MIKNEESVIEKTLKPFVQSGMHSFLIFDTGSTDSTVKTVRQFFKNNNIKNGHIIEEPFIDFATSRNRALDLGSSLFTDSEFLLMPDAEWYMHNVKGLIDFCHEHSNHTCDCYYVKLQSENLAFFTPRLFKRDMHARFEGDIHESVVPNRYYRVPSSIFFEFAPSQKGIEKSRQRWELDLQKLLKRYNEDPKSSRTTFYLAQTYQCLGDLENAHHYYMIRTQQKGWIDEQYEAYFRLGGITEVLSKTHDDYSWQQALHYYFKAHQLKPHRAEPLVKLAEHYWSTDPEIHNPALCYLFAKAAYEKPYPHEDILFVNPEMYNFRRYELLSFAAWYVGDFALGKLCTKKALAYKRAPHLLKNLECYRSQKKSQAQKLY